MAVIGEIAVNVVANTQPLERGMSRAKGAVQSFESSLGRFNSLVGVAMPLSLGAAAAAVMRVASSLGDLQDEADRLNASTGGLQSLQFIGTQVGTKFESLTMALGSMQVRLAEVAETGKGPASDALKKLGLNASTLIGMKSDDAFSAIAEGISSIDNAAQRASLAVDLFGKAGKQIVNTLALGSDGIAKMRKEAEALGLVLREDTVKAAAQFDDQMQSFLMWTKAQAGRVVGEGALAAQGASLPMEGGVSPVHNPYFLFPGLNLLVGAQNSKAISAPAITEKEKARLEKEKYVAEALPGLAGPSFISTFVNDMAKQMRLGVREVDSKITTGGSSWFGPLRMAEDWISKKNREMELRQWEFDNRKQVPGAAGPVSVGMSRAIDYNSNEGRAFFAERKNQEVVVSILTRIAVAAEQELKKKPLRVEVEGIQ